MENEQRTDISTINGKMVKLVVRNPKTGPVVIELRAGRKLVGYIAQDDFFDDYGNRFNYDNIPLEG